MVSVSASLRALVGKDKGLPAKSLAPSIRTDTGSSPHEETREL